MFNQKIILCIGPLKPGEDKLIYEKEFTEAIRTADILSNDNYLSLQTDNTSSHNDLPGLGIKPRSIESVVPGYLAGSPHQHRLDKYRKRASE